MGFHYHKQVKGKRSQAENRHGEKAYQGTGVGVMEMVGWQLSFQCEPRKASLIKRKKGKLLSHPQLFGNLWTVAYQGPLSMGFSRKEYWSGLPFTSPGDLPNPGIEPRSPALQADGLPSGPL